MNRNSNTYQILYSAIMVILVGAVLAFVYMELKPKQDENKANDTRSQILSAIHKTAADGEVGATFDKYIVKQYLIDAQGNVTDSTQDVAFKVDMKANVKNHRRLFHQF